MSMIRNAVPASLRRPVESARLVQEAGRVLKASPASTQEAHGVSGAKSRFGRLPEESEDARLTGATRSLNRRLLALNVPGSFRLGVRDLISKIA